MTTAISPDQYCAHPEDYKNAPLTDTTRAYWDQYCELRKEASQSKIPDGKSLGDMTSETLNNFIMMFLSPQALQFLGEIMGGVITFQIAKTALGAWIKSGLSPEILASAEKFIEEGGDAFIANGTGIIHSLFGTILKTIDYVSLEVAEKAGYSAGRYAVAGLVRVAEMLGEMATEIMDIAMVIQLIGMVFDAWDPCNLNDQLDASQLKNFTNMYNEAFMSTMLSSLSSSKDSYGNTTVNGTWPLEYYAENSALIPFKNDYYDGLKQKYFMEYVNSLQYNSDGDPIFHGLGGKLISNELISGLELDSLVFFGNSNTVVENWLMKWWPVIGGIFILLIIVLIYLIRKK